jgi:hypothetical protein
LVAVWREGLLAQAVLQGKTNGYKNHPQLDFEVKHLLSKLQKRSNKDYKYLVSIESIGPHPSFEIVPGDMEDWEKGIKDKRTITN